MKRTVLSIAAVIFLHSCTRPSWRGSQMFICFEIVAGECPTLVFVKNRDVQIKIESYAMDGTGITDRELRQRTGRVRK